jgi:polyferredoxin
MKRKTSKTLTFISLLLFPVTFNFFSPYVSLDGAFKGFITGSLLVFALMTLTGLVFRRAWCSYLCPWAAPSLYIGTINDRRVNRKVLRRIRYTVFTIWFIILIVAFILAGGVKRVDPLYLTETGISVDMPIKYITYYMVVALLFLLTILIGRRGACQSICWMSPFLVFGSWVGEKLRIPQFMVRSQPERCISCRKCTSTCPMSIEVMEELKNGRIDSHDCILCGRCVDACPQKVLSIALGVKPIKPGKA